MAITFTVRMFLIYYLEAGAPNSAKFTGGVAEGYPRFDKGGGCNILLFRVFTLSD